MEASSTIVLKDAVLFQNEAPILSNIDLNLKQGEFVYLIGKTGSGKSSLLKSLYGELPLKQGEGSVVGYDLKKLKRKQIPLLRRKIGIVFQDFQLLPDRTVRENLRFFLKATGWKKRAEIDAKMDEVLEKVGLTTKAFKMPHQLSGGEQQRVGIARALLNDPDLILADEPTGNLDPETSSEIIKLLFDISNNQKTVLMATHDFTIMESYPAKTIKCENQKLTELKPFGSFNPLKSE